MAKGTLSIFVDESGIFKYPDSLSSFYILSLVLLDQSQDISRPLADLSRGVADLGFDPDDFVFHAGRFPTIPPFQLSFGNNWNNL